MWYNVQMSDAWAGNIQNKGEDAPSHEAIQSE